MRIGLDLDGTLISCMEKHTSLMKAILKAHGKKVNIDEYWFYKRDGLNNIQSLKKCGIENRLSELLNKQWVEQIELVQWMDLDTVFQGVCDFLDKQLHNKNTLHLISARNNKRNSFLQLQKLNLVKYFETIDFVSGNLGENKRHKFIQRNIDIYIGDAEQDFKQSQFANIKCLLLISGMRSKEFLRSQDAPVFTNLSEVDI